MIVENAWAIPMHLSARRGPAPHDRGAPAAGDRPSPRLLVGARAIRHAASFPRCSRWPSRPTCRGCGTSASTASRRGQLRERRGIRSTVMPNVFDFDRPRPRRAPAVRRRLRTELGMSERGLLVVQPTRVVPRKGIELAIELVGRLKDPDAVLLITSPAGDEGLDYLVRARAAGGAPQGAPGATRPIASRPTTRASRSARALAPRRVPGRRPDHLSEPVRGLRQRTAGGASTTASRWS